MTIKGIFAAKATELNNVKNAINIAIENKTVKTIIDHFFPLRTKYISVTVNENLMICCISFFVSMGLIFMLYVTIRPLS